ncbi:putative ribonuclease H-like domain-containing protein [Tanacetum coccineum]
MAMLTMKAKRFLNKTGRKINANGSETIRLNKSKVECYNCHKKGHFTRECRALRENMNRELVRRNVTVETAKTKALVAQDGLGYDWSDQAKEGPTNFALVTYTSSSSSSSSSSDYESQLNVGAYKAGLEYVEARLDVYKKQMSLERNLKKMKMKEIQVSDKFKTGVGYDSQVIDSQVFDSQVNDKHKTGKGYHAVPPPYTRNFMPPKPNLVLADEEEYIFSESITSVPAVATSKVKTIESKPKSVSEPLIEDWISDSKDKNETEFKSKQRKPSFAKVEFVKSNKHVKTPRESVKKVENNKQAKYPKKNSQSPRVAVSVNTAKPINTAYLRLTVNSARTASNVFNRAHSRVRRPFKKSTTNKNTNLNKKVNTVKGNVTTAGPKAVVSDNKGNEANASKACRSKSVMAGSLREPDSLTFCARQSTARITGKGVIDIGCSRHMTGNKSYLSDYEEINGRFVAFGGDPKGGKITGKGKIGTGKLDFEDVYFVKELKFNLFNVSQMCDKKNSVLFTNTECVVLSPDFMLLDQNHVLLRVPRKDNMYSVDLKNIVHSRGLTCLFAKATLDESNLWHRRLRYINFKTMNKLVRGNLIRGLPSKIFENNHTCVACQKGKQHKASYRKPALSFMRPFGCPVTILNTIDHLGKFDEKADEGFFVGYSTNSKALKVFNSRTRIVEENLYVKFSEDTPNIVGSEPNYLFNIDALTKSINYEQVVARNQSNGCAGTKACDDVGKAKMETLPSKDYILLPFLTQDPSFSSGLKDSPDARFKPLGRRKRRMLKIQRMKIVSTNNINNVSPTVNVADIENNVADKNKVYGCDDDPNMPNLEEIVYSDDDKGVDAKADMTNLDTHILASPTPTIRIH